MKKEDSVTVLEIASFALSAFPDQVGMELDLGDEELDRLYQLIGEEQFEIEYAIPETDETGEEFNHHYGEN
jgi:hypothetical protein